MMSTHGGRYSKSISDYFLLFSLKFSHWKDIFIYFICKKKVEIEVSFLGNNQTQDSFPLDSDCVVGSLADVPT